MIKSLSKSEFNQLEAYINSPFFLKKNKDPLKLYLAIKEYAPKFDLTKLSKAAVFESVYPKVKYNDGKMRNLLSRTVKIVDSYLLYLDNEGDEFGRDKRLSEVYNKRNIESEFFNYSRRLLADLEKVEQKDTTYYFNKFFIEKELYFHLNNDKKETTELLKNTIFNFQNYLGLEQANIELEVNNKKQMFNYPIELPTITISPKIITHNLNLTLLTQINQLLIEKDILLYIKIIADFESNLSKLGNKEGRDMYIALQNFGARAASKNFNLYGPILFKLYQIGLKNKLLMVNGEILVFSYLNIVIVGLKIGNYKWTTSFINNFEKFLPTKIAKTTKQYSLCSYYFIVGEYEKVLEITNTFKFNEIGNFRVITAKSLKIRSLYFLLGTDKSYYKLLINQCAAFDKYIEREKSLIKNRKLMYKNFTSTIRKMAHPINNNKWENKKKKAIKLEVEKNKNIRYKEWLLEILN